MTTPAADAERVHAYTERLPPATTILTYLREHARTQGDDPYLTTVGAGGELVTHSYRELDVLTARLAGWLRRELGAGPGGALALLPLNDAASVVALFAALRTGSALLVLNPADPPARLRQQTEAAAATAVLRSPAVPAQTLPDALPVPARVDAEPSRERELAGSADALLFGTSGSTAASKLVVQSHANAVANAEALRRHHRLSRGDRLFGCLPIHHVNGVHFTLVATLAAGAHAVLAPRFEPLAYPRLIAKVRPRIASVVPSILEALLETWRRPDLPSGFEYFVSAAAPLASSTVRGVAERLGARVLQGYGLTETTNFSTTMPRDLPAATLRRLGEEAEIPSVGTALYGNEVAILGADGDRLAPGEIGEVCMRGHNVMSRYGGNAEATAEAFRGGWFHSQDLGFELVDPESGRSFYVLTGRTKNIAKVRGESVSLDELDRLLRAVPQVQDAACVALPHRLLGDEIVAAVVFAPGTDGIDLRPALRRSLSAAALPGRFLAFDAIPRTPTGKIRRTALADEVAAHLQRPGC